jgi:hypothetical protein
VVTDSAFCARLPFRHRQCARSSSLRLTQRRDPAHAYVAKSKTNAKGRATKAVSKRQNFNLAIHTIFRPSIRKLLPRPAPHPVFVAPTNENNEDVGTEWNGGSPRARRPRKVVPCGVRTELGPERCRRLNRQGPMQRSDYLPSLPYAGEHRRPCTAWRETGQRPSVKKYFYPFRRNHASVSPRFRRQRTVKHTLTEPAFLRRSPIPPAAMRSPRKPGKHPHRRRKEKNIS